MTKTFTLQPLINLAQHKSDEATRRLGLLNQKQQSTQQQLDTLLEYRKEYQRRLQEATHNGTDPTYLKNFHAFIGKLDDAIRQQSQLVEQSKQSVQAGRDVYQQTQRTLKSYDTLHQRYIETQQQVAAKKEQKIQDEHSNRAATYKAQQINHDDEQSEQ